MTGALSLERTAGVAAPGRGRVPRVSARAQAPALPSDVASFTASEPRAQALAAGVVAAWQALPSMTATSDVVVWRDGRVLRSQTVDAAYRAPGHVTLAVTQGEGKGATINWDGGPTARVHKVIDFTWPLTHGKLLNPLGWTLRDTAPGMVMRVLSDPRTRVRSLPDEGGLPVIEVRSPACPPGITREVMVIDPQRRLLVERRCYADADLRYISTARRFQPGG